MRASILAMVVKHCQNNCRSAHTPLGHSSPEVVKKTIRAQTEVQQGKGDESGIDAVSKGIEGMSVKADSVRITATSTATVLARIPGRDKNWQMCVHKGGFYGAYCRDYDSDFYSDYCTDNRDNCCNCDYSGCDGD